MWARNTREFQTRLITSDERIALFTKEYLPVDHRRSSAFAGGMMTQVLAAALIWGIDDGKNS